jgi:hypothetical protein
VLGALGIVSPIVQSRNQREHELKLSRAARLHEQRLGVYRDLGHFLEMERTRIDRVEPIMTVGEPRELPPEPTDDEWAQLHGSVAVAGSDEVRTALNEFHASVGAFAGHSFTFRELRRQDVHGQQVQDSYEAMQASRKVAYAKLDETERVMRDELARL